MYVICKLSTLLKSTLLCLCLIHACLNWIYVNNISSKLLCILEYVLLTLLSDNRVRIKYVSTTLLHNCHVRIKHTWHIDHTSSKFRFGYHITFDESNFISHIYLILSHINIHAYEIIYSWTTNTDLIWHYRDIYYGTHQVDLTIKIIWYCFTINS